MTTVEIDGLKDMIACNTRISSIIDDHLSYAGYDISEFMNNKASFEEVIYLLWNGHLPTQMELKYFETELRKNYDISDAVEQCILIQSRPLFTPDECSSFNSFYLVYIMWMLRKDPWKVYQQSIELMAKLPTIITTFARLRTGKMPLKPRKDLGFAANFLYMLNGVEPSEIEIEAMNKTLILHADHELNASTFAARVCASTLTDIYSCVTTAIGALKGPLHGGANERVFDMLKEVRESGDVNAYLQEKLDSKEKIMGFGHRVYKKKDPREIFLRDMAKVDRGTENEEFFNKSQEIEEFMRDKKGLIPNVDFYSATVYHTLGIDSDIFTLIFAMSRVASWIAHIHEQQKNNKLIRPRSQYIGQENMTYIALEKR
ncbi:MAG: citrate synthase [Streptococcus thermophilus]